MLRNGQPSKTHHYSSPCRHPAALATTGWRGGFSTQEGTAGTRSGLQTSESASFPISESPTAESKEQAFLTCLNSNCTFPRIHHSVGARSEEKRNTLTAFQKVHKWEEAWGGRRAVKPHSTWGERYSEYAQHRHSLRCESFKDPGD